MENKDIGENDDDIEWLKKKLRGIVDEGKEIILNTAEFFQKSEKEVGYIDPIIFGVFMGLISGLILTFYSIIGLSNAGLLSFILVPIFTVIGIFICGFILHIIAIFMGTKRGYDASFRIAAYMTVLSPIGSLISPIPFVEILIVGFGAYLLAVSFPIVHEVSRRTSNYIFGIIAGIIILAILITTGNNEMIKGVDESGYEEIREKLEKLNESLKEMKKNK